MITRLNPIYNLIKFELLRVRRSAKYWLRVLGIDEQGNQWMNLYLIGYMLFWVAAMWGWGVDNVFAIGRQLTSNVTLAVGQGAALAYIALAIVIIFNTLRSMPLKLTYPQIFIEASSPINRAALTLVTFTRFQVLIIALSGVITCFGVMLLNIPRADSPFDVGVLGLTGLFTGAALMSATAFWGWSVSIWWHGLRRNPARQPLFLKLLYSILFACGIGLQVYFGVMFMLALFSASLTVTAWGRFALMLSLSFAVFVWTASAISMTDVIEQSAVFARISKLNPMANADLIAQIKRQMSLAKRRWRVALSSIPLQKFPESNRALHALINHSPGQVIKLFFIGMSYASFATLLTQEAFINQPQFWMILLMLLIYQRPRVLAESFEQVIGNSWLRQFHDRDNFQLFAYSSLPNLLIAACGAVIVFALQGQAFAELLFLSIAILGLFVLLALCQAVALVRLRGFITKRLGYEYALMLAAIPLFLVYALTQSALMVFFMLIVLIAGYAHLLAESA